jgi:Na+/glutamate symporter
MTGTFAFSVNTPHGFAGAPGNYFIAVDNGAPPPAVDIVVPVTNLIGYAGGSICLIGQCGGQASVAATAATSSGFTSGNLTATAPEPASLALVGAALGCLAMWRRRRNAA